MSMEDISEVLRPREESDPSDGGRQLPICCDPGRNVHRFIVLIFICFLNFGSYFCFDNPAALEDVIERDLSLSNTKYSLLYSVYSWPNVLFPFFGGFLIDRVFGLRLGAGLFAAFIMAGQIVFAGGALANSFFLLLLGRIIFSVGGENLAVCQNNYAVKWFKGKELNLVFGIQLSFARVGSTVNMYVMGPLYNWLQALMPAATPGYSILGAALMIGGLSTVVSFLISLVLAYCDVRYDRYMLEAGSMAESDESEGETVSLRDILHFPLSFWLICAVCVAFYNAIFPLVSLGLVFYESKYQLHPSKADICNSLIYLISIGASPICGGLVDRFGRNLNWILGAVLLSLFGHGLLAFTFLTPYVAVVILGVAYSLLAASLWPLVAYVIPERLLGSAYGAMQAIQNLGLGVIFLSAGAILDARGYFMLELYFILWLSVALGFSLLLVWADQRKGGVLNMTSSSRREQVEQQKKSM